MVAATDIPHKHFNGNGLHGAPPVDFHNERVYIQSVATDMKTITLTTPLKYTHISTNYRRPLDDEFIDLSAEVALLSRNVKIQGEGYHSERDQWGGHTMVLLSGRGFYRLGQTGEVSRYPIHFHITQDYGQNCYARYNSIHHSFQRAVAIHSTNYVNVKGNVAFDIIGHMFFVETGMEMHNTLEGNLAVGAIPLLSGMLESDQEPAGFWTAAPNNVWRDNVAVTGSDGWYFQLPDTPISHNMDIYKDSICPKGTRIGEWRRNRCHHLPGSCIRIYLTWIPRKEPCNTDSAEDPQILFNTTCWGIGKACYNAMKMGSVHNHHMTAVEGGKQDYESIKFIRAAPAPHGNKFETDWQNIPHIKDSVFVRILPQNLGKKSSKMSMSVQLPQNEQFYVTDSMWVNTGETPVFKGCAKCWSFVKWRQGAHTYRFKGLSFTNATRRIQVYKKDILWDLDGTLTGTADSYTSWADAFNLGHPDCAYTQITYNTSEDGTQTETTWYSSTGTTSDEPSIFFSGADIYQHEVRNHTFMTCTTPIRKFGIAWPEPQEVHLRQLTVTNLDTGLFQQHEFEKNEIFGWGFPVVANQRLEVRPNFLGMDLTEAGIQYGFNDLLASKESDALKAKKTADPEWLQLQVAFWMDYNHVKLTNPYSWWVGTRYGEALLPYSLCVLIRASDITRSRAAISQTGREDANLADLIG
ncbi:Fibrocystin-L (Polycystic kidney and hepatic disease 1-like protein 1) (PKHD1-like protein 1) (Protein D86) [Durusdinium trenchii]|uniref:Fibrocystin-L (Polycystic kidney and hepatic disease 1-like protein 1) (PKHD1-like protein 1) (Protein D86) n=1 Tax=Durusdinium trenchii TaxID=1381693 RepID=A0ABP0S2B1_9DINO